MIGIPFDIRPDRPEKPGRNYPPEQDGFSDMLTALLALVLKDGYARRSLISMLKDIYPYADANDRKRIEKLVCADMRAETLKKGCVADTLCTRQRVLSRTDRALGMMNAIKKYSSKKTGDILSGFCRIMELSKLAGNCANDPLALISHILPEGSLGDIGEMMRMMNGFGNNDR